ncbi:MAG TPA: hypothetical protein VFO16_11340 [Pseudonocardiaceae bacterium]|nr:hypothetical protein [Pseudonocardiaceae bacterium]
MTEPIMLDALGPTGAYRAHNRQPIVDVAGNPVAELSLVPRLLVTRTMSALRKARTLPLEQRLTALAKAGERFATETINGLSPADYQYMVSHLGIPLTTVRGAIDVIRRSATGAYFSAHTPGRWARSTTGAMG